MLISYNIIDKLIFLTYNTWIEQKSCEVFIGGSACTETEFVLKKNPLE